MTLSGLLGALAGICFGLAFYYGIKINDKLAISWLALGVFITVGFVMKSV